MSKKYLIYTDESNKRILLNYDNMPSGKYKTNIELNLNSPEEKNKKQVVFQSGNYEFYLLAEDYIDIDVEIKKLDKKIEDLSKTLAVSRSRLENDKFIKNAKEELIEKEKQNVIEVENEIELLKQTRDQFSV